MQLIAVIPVYNHGESVGAIVAALLARGLSVILVDDGSEPSCARTLAAIARAHPPVKLLVHPENRGKGAAVMSGFAEALAQGASHVLQIDADGQHDLSALPDFLAASSSQPEAVINGCPRYDASAPASRRYARYLTHVWVWINTLSLDIRDSMCGFRIYPLAAVSPLLPKLAHAARMEFDTEILVRLHWAGVAVVNQPVAVRYPPGALSHFRLWHDNVRISAMHARLFCGLLPRLPRLLYRRLARRLPGN